MSTLSVQRVARILIVDDLVSQRRILADLMTGEGLQADACESVSEALQLVAEHDFSVAVVDQRLGESSGIDFLAKLRDSSRSLRVIIHTAFGSFAAVKSSLNLGAYAYVEKAGDPAELIGHVHRAIGESMEEALLRSEERLSAFLFHSPSGITLKDINGRYLFVNREHEQRHGIRLEDIVGKTAHDIHPLELADTLAEQDRAVLATSRSIEERIQVNTTGRKRTILVVKFPVFDENENITAIGSIGTDVSEADMLERKLAYHATHDALTGLLNRYEFESRLKRVLETAQASEARHALCYLDLDQFKVINDTCGHVAGDSLLQQLSKCLLARVRGRDTLARLGGDEFALLLEHCTLNQAQRVAEELRAAVENFRFSRQGKTFSIGVSIGVVAIGAEGQSVTDALSSADSACYVAKDLGRNRIHIYHGADEELQRRRGEMEWVARINEALEMGRFQLYRQPIVPLGDNAKNDQFFELLLRLKESGGNVITPETFLPAAERYNVASRIDRWVVSSSFAWFSDCSRHIENNVMCSINLSAQSVSEESFLDFVKEQFSQKGIAASRICFEITETAAMANFESARVFINELKILGCKFALDDFGSGFSSFAYLKQLPVDYIKIDGVFVRDVATNPVSLAMVKSINEIGQVMGKKIIAEFAEDDDVVDRLRDIKVDFAQGFALGSPHPVSQCVIEANVGNLSS